MKRAFLLLLSAAIAFSSQAQKLRLGLQASPSLNWMKGSDKIAADGMTFGYSFGLMMDYYFTEHYGFSSGLFITSSTGKIKYNQPAGFKEKGFFTAPIFPWNDTIAAGTTAEYKIARYIEVPVLLKLRTGEIGYITYFGVFGVTPGINIKSNAVFDVSDPSLPDITITKMNLLNLQLTVGGGLEYSLAETTSLAAGILFNNGFMGVTRDEERVILNNFLLRLGIIF